MIERARALLFVLIGCSLLAAAPAFGTTVHGNFVGTTVDFNGVQETTQLALDPTDPEPLWEAPIVIGDSLFFSPTAFTAAANGAFGFDGTSSLLEMVISATSGTISTINITEAGDTILGGAGTAATSTNVGLSGIATVVEQGGLPIAPVQIPWAATFSQDTFTLPGDAGATAWIGSISIDVASVVPNATEVILDIDNTLFAFSEAGTAALIQKKTTDGLIITVPEPATFALLGLGLLSAAASGRRRR